MLRGCSIDCLHQEVKLYNYGLVGTTEYVLYTEVKLNLLCPLFGIVLQGGGQAIARTLKYEAA